MAIHIEQTLESTKIPELSQRPADVQREYLRDAQDATDEEHDLTLLKAIRLYPKAIAWSMLLSTAIVMEGYDLKLIGSLYAQPAFQQKYGQRQANGSYQISAAWQAGLTNGATVGSLMGLFMAGYVSEKIGFKKTMLGALTLITALIFIPFFAPSIEVLQVGQVLMGIPWGVFQTLTTAYAVEVTPVHLRAYLTTYVNLCWVFGQFIAGGVLRGTLNITSEWGYRIPFAIQWVWPIPLIIGISFAPESPWWLVRVNRLDEAKASLLRLTSPSRVSFNVEKTVAMMVVTTEHEKECGTGTRYLDCFRGIDRRRTIISCMCYMTQILSGTGLRSFSTYFYQQAGLPTEQAFNMSIVQYALGIIGVFIAWFLLPRLGRRELYIYGLLSLAACLLAIGGLGVASSLSPSSAISWAIGSMLLVYTLFYDITIGPVAYTLVAEIPAVQLRNKSIVLARISYNILNIVSNTITPYMLNPTAWAWGAKAGFFFAGTCFLALVFTYFFVPEPKGRTFAEMDLLFEKGVSARRFASTQVSLTEIADDLDKV